MTLAFDEYPLQAVTILKAIELVVGPHGFGRAWDELPISVRSIPVDLQLFGVKSNFDVGEAWAAGSQLQVSVVRGPRREAIEKVKV